LTGSEEKYLIVNIGKDKFAINTCSIESIHSSASISFSEDLNRCLPESGMDWEKSIPVIKPNCSSKNESESSLENQTSRVIFLSDDSAGRIVALIVNTINKVVNVSTEKEELTKNGIIEKIQINNKEVEIFDISNVFMT